MYRMDMWYTIKTLLDKGKSIRRISEELGISRITVKRIKNKIEAGQLIPAPVVKNKLLESYHDYIKSLHEREISAVLIHQRLQQEKGLTVSYSTVRRYVSELKLPQAYIPINCAAGEEGQVDFGYLGKFKRNNKCVKVWAFCMTLSYSRYAYYQVVTDQKTSTFIQCHINAFEYFKGAPKVVKIDNLKAAVLEANFYEPLIQQQYMEFLKYYQSAPITARVRRPQDKGKVESGIKYVKNNFLKNLDHSNYENLQAELMDWTNKICNQRVHGTTRKVPFQLYQDQEKAALLPLPVKRYQVWRVETRIVKPNGHVSYDLNYYSVPHQFVHQQVTVKSDTKLIRIYKENQQIAMHPVNDQNQGEYVTQADHLPLEKARKSHEYYLQRCQQVGPHLVELMEQMRIQNYNDWHRPISGIIRLAKTYGNQIVDQACQRALQFNSIKYQTVKSICKSGLYQQPTESLTVIGADGNAHDLKKYDNLTC